MEQVWEILKEYLGEAILFIAMILRTARSGTTVEEKKKKKRAKISARVVKKLQKLQKDIEYLEENPETETEQSLENSSMLCLEGKPFYTKFGEENGSGNR